MIFQDLHEQRRACTLYVRFTISRQPSFLQLLPGDDVGGEILLLFFVLVFLLGGLDAWIELPKAISFSPLLTATGTRLLLIHLW